MAVVQTLIGNVKGPQGETGATGATGAKGDAATITVGSVSTTAYGNAARVENVGTENDAILNFTIPQGAPGQRTTTMSGLTLDTVTTSAEEFPVPAVGENGATVWGKVIKWFQDGLAAITAKLDANKVVNSQAVTEAGYALDAQQANPNVSGSLAAQISDLNDSLANHGVYYGGTFDTTSISGNSAQNKVAEMSLPAGVYVINASCQWASNFTEVTGIYFDGIGSNGVVRNTGTGGGGLNITAVVKLLATTTVSVYVYQASSSSKPINQTRFAAVKLS